MQVALHIKPCTSKENGPPAQRAKSKTSNCLPLLGITGTPILGWLAAALPAHQIHRLFFLWYTREGGGGLLSHTGTNSNTKVNIIHSTCTIQRKLHLTFCACIQSVSVSSMFCVKRHWQYMSVYTSCTCWHALLSALRRETRKVHY